MTTDQLIKYCIKGDPESEKQLFLRFGSKVLTLCRRYVVQDAIAKDLMQECFIQIFDNLKKYDAEKGEFGGWLHRICTNVVLKYLRKEKISVSFVYPDVLPDRAEEVDKTAFDKIPNEILLESIQELPDGYRQILNLYIFEGMKHQEIAEILNISSSTSRSQYTRAKQLLKAILQKKIKNLNQYYERRLA